jgi:hypothetical protein
VARSLAPRPYLENLIVLEIKTNKQTFFVGAAVACIDNKHRNGLPLRALQSLENSFLGFLSSGNFPLGSFILLVV